MIDIIVFRGDNPVDGDDITDPLLSSLSAAIARGTAEIDSNAFTRPVQAQVVYRAGLMTGQVVEVADGLQGETWRGKITGLTMGVEGEQITATMSILRLP